MVDAPQWCNENFSTRLKSLCAFYKHGGMIPVVQPKPDTPYQEDWHGSQRQAGHWLQPGSFWGTPAERAACQQRWSLTSVSLRLTNGISDLEASSAKGLLAGVFVCKIGMLMRPSNGFFYALHSGNCCWQKGRKKSTFAGEEKHFYCSEFVPDVRH